MSIKRLRTYLATEKRGYGIHDISRFYPGEITAALPAASVFGNAVKLFGESVLGSKGFQHADKRANTTGGVIRTCVELERLTALLHGRVKAEVEKAVKSIREADETTVQKVTGWQLTKLQRLFLEYGIYVNEISQTEHGVVLGGRNIHVGITKIYPYVRFNDVSRGNFGSFYGVDDGGAQQVIVLDISRAVGMICGFVNTMGDESDYERTDMLSSGHLDTERLRAAVGKEGVRLFRACLSIVMGKTFYQALKKEEDSNPEKWYLNIVNSLIRTIATHEKVHALLQEAGVEVANEEISEALAMMGQLAYGPEEMALSLLFAFDRTTSITHYRAAMRVIAGELEMNGIPIDGRGIPKLLDLKACDMADSAKISLERTFLLSTGRRFSDIVPTAELREIASMDFVGPQHLPLLNALRHIPLD